MARYNHFGKTFSDVIQIYPGTAVADYDAGGAAGQAAIEAALTRASMEVAGSLPASTFDAITNVNAEKVIAYAPSAPVTSLTLGMIPVVAGSLHLWVYPLLPPAGYSDNYSISDIYYRAPVKGFYEVSTDDYSVVAATGVVTYNGAAISEGSSVYASYTVDMDNAAFASVMLGQIAVLGAAAELGGVLYSSGTQEWALVTQYRERYQNLLESLRSGGLVPDEIRRLCYWSEIEKSDNTGGSIRLPRG